MRALWIAVVCIVCVVAGGPIACSSASVPKIEPVSTKTTLAVDLEVIPSTGVLEVGDTIFIDAYVANIGTNPARDVTISVYLCPSAEDPLLLGSELVLLIEAQEGAHMYADIIVTTALVSEIQALTGGDLSGTVRAEISSMSINEDVQEEQSVMWFFVSPG